MERINALFCRLIFADVLLHSLQVFLGCNDKLGKIKETQITCDVMVLARGSSGCCASFLCLFCLGFLVGV